MLPVILDKSNQKNIEFYEFQKGMQTPKFCNAIKQFQSKLFQIKC